MKNRCCPHCGTPYRIIELDKVPVLYCDKCHTHINFNTRTYHFNETKSPKNIRDSFAAVRLILDRPFAVFLSKAKLFTTSFTLENMVVVDHTTGKYISAQRAKKLIDDGYELIGMRGAFAYGALNIMRESLATESSMNPFGIPRDTSVNRALFFPVVTEAMIQYAPKVGNYDGVINQFFRITLEGKVKLVYNMFEDGVLSPLSDEYLLLSNATLDPFTVIGTPKSSADTQDKVKKFINAYTDVKDIRTEEFGIPFQTDRAIQEYASAYLRATPSTGINTYGADEVVNFDIYEHVTYDFKYKSGNAMTSMAMLGFLSLLECLCRKYMGHEFTDYGIAFKERFLEKCGAPVPTDPKDVVLDFWKEVTKKIKESDGTNDEIS